MNQIILKGKIIETLQEYEAYNRKFAIIKVATNRLSGIADELIVHIPYSKYEFIDTNKFVEINGSVRTKNETIDDKQKLKLYVFANTVRNIEDQEYENKVCLAGFICKLPNLRETPLKKQICDFTLAINKEKSNHSYYIPCIAWSTNAKFVSKLKPNNKEMVYCQGRLQSRTYKKIINNIEESHITYELSVESIGVHMPDSEAFKMAPETQEQ